MSFYLKGKGAFVPNVSCSKSYLQLRRPSINKIHFQSVSSENTAQLGTGHEDGVIEENPY